MKGLCSYLGDSPNGIAEIMFSFSELFTITAQGSRDRWNLLAIYYGLFSQSESCVEWFYSLLGNQWYGFLIFFHPFLETKHTVHLQVNYRGCTHNEPIWYIPYLISSLMASSCSCSIIARVWASEWPLGDNMSIELKTVSRSSSSTSEISGSLSKVWAAVAKTPPGWVSSQS